MKMNRKLATILFIVTIALSSVAYATYSIYSNVIEDTVGEYNLGSSLIKDDSQPVLYTNMTLTGTLRYNGVGVEGKTVYLLQSPDQITWANIQSATTNATGHFTFQVNRTILGTFYYKAGYNIP